MATATVTWQNSPAGQELEQWIAINPASICDLVRVPADADSIGVRLSAFDLVDHVARCLPQASCRTILALAAQGRCAEACGVALVLTVGA